MNAVWPFCINDCFVGRSTTSYQSCLEREDNENQKEFGDRDAKETTEAPIVHVLQLFITTHWCVW